VSDPWGSRPSNPQPPEGPDDAGRWAPPPQWEPAPSADELAYLPAEDPAASPFGMNLGYAVDIVFVIDITGSMGAVIDAVKAGALTFHDRLLATMAEKGKYVTGLRLRIVAYRDVYDNPADALFATPFFRLPGDGPHFQAYVDGLFAQGGGDEPESGLEALAVAMGSDWERGMDRRRHVIVVFTDASAHPLEASHGRTLPPHVGVVGSFDELTDRWDDPQGAQMEFAAKRLLLYAPDVYPWQVISTNWANVLHFPSRAGEGLGEVEFSQIIDAIAGSV
jgi:hypothetical protein